MAITSIERSSGLAKKCIQWVKDNAQAGATIDKLCASFGITKDHLRRVASGKRGASVKLLKMMENRVTACSLDSLDDKGMSQSQKNAIKNRKVKDMRHSVYRDVIDNDGISPADVADTRYHGYLK